MHTTIFDYRTTYLKWLNPKSLFVAQIGGLIIAQAAFMEEFNATATRNRKIFASKEEVGWLFYNAVSFARCVYIFEKYSLEPSKKKALFSSGENIKNIVLAICPPQVKRRLGNVENIIVSTNKCAVNFSTPTAETKLIEKIINFTCNFYSASKKQHFTPLQTKPSNTLQTIKNKRPKNFILHTRKHS